MKKLTTVFLVGASMATFGVSLAGCAPTTTTTSLVQVTSDTMVIDVRTPAEFGEGHLSGAVNIDWEGADFSDQITGLDKTEAYVLYCRSGRRAAEAMSMMQSMGFTNVSHLGGIDEAASVTGLSVVTQ